MDTKQAVVFLHRNNVNCFYVVDDLTILDNVMSFHIEDTLYKFQFSLLAYNNAFGDGIYDCTKLQAIN